MPIRIGTAQAWGRLRDAFDLKGKHSLQLDEVVVPVAIVEDLSRDEPLGNLRAAQGGITTAATAAIVGQTQLFNPVDSLVILELYAVMWRNASGNSLFQMGPTAAALATDTFGQFQDRRGAAAALPVGRIQSAISAAAATLVAPALMGAISPRPNEFRGLNVFLPAGTGWMIENTVVNQQINISYFWFERAAQ